MSTTPNTKQDGAPAVHSSALLAELESSKDRLAKLEEMARGPGKHQVFMCIHGALKCCKDAIIAETYRRGDGSVKCKLL